MFADLFTTHHLFFSNTDQDSNPHKGVQRVTHLAIQTPKRPCCEKVLARFPVFSAFVNQIFMKF